MVAKNQLRSAERKTSSSHLDPGRTTTNTRLENDTTAATKPEARADVPQQAGDNADGAGKDQRSAGDTRRHRLPAARSSASDSQPPRKSREDKMLTMEQFNEAIANNTKLPSFLLPWHQDFVNKFGREAQNQYENITSMMNEYRMSIQKRSATRQEEKAELQEYLRECRAKWRKQKRKEQGKQMRGCRGQGQQRKLSRAVRKVTAEPTPEEPELRQPDPIVAAAAEEEPTPEDADDEDGLSLLCEEMYFQMCREADRGRKNGLVISEEMAVFHCALSNFWMHINEDHCQGVVLFVETPFDSRGR